MKFKLVNDNGSLDLIAANGELMTCLEDEQVKNYLLDFQPIVPVEDGVEELKKYEGQLIMALRDDNVLEIYDIEFLRNLLKMKDFPYYSIQEYCDTVDKKRSIVQRRCKNGDIQGAVNIGNTWFIPKGTVYPPDSRRKNTPKK